MWLCDCFVQEGQFIGRLLAGTYYRDRVINADGSFSHFGCHRCFIYEFQFTLSSRPGLHSGGGGNSNMNGNNCTGSCIFLFLLPLHAFPRTARTLRGDHHLSILPNLLFTNHPVFRWYRGSVRVFQSRGNSDRCHLPEIERVREA